MAWLSLGISLASLVVVILFGVWNRVRSSFRDRQLAQLVAMKAEAAIVAAMIGAIRTVRAAGDLEAGEATLRTLEAGAATGLEELRLREVPSPRLRVVSDEARDKAKGKSKDEGDEVDPAAASVAAAAVAGAAA